MMSSRERRILAVIAAAVLFGCAAAADAAEPPESVSVPLHVVPLSNGGSKIGIEIRLGGGPKRLYEFDTGASGFYAAGNDAWWPSYEPLPDGPIVQSYASGVTYVADKVRTKVAIPSDHGDVEAELDVARITDGYGGPLGSQKDSLWNRDVAEGKPPLYGAFFGDFGGDLRFKDGLASLLPQLPGNLSSGFIVELGCERRGGPRLIIGLTDANRARFRTRVAMQPGTGETFPVSGLPTYAQQIIVADYELSRRGVVQGFTSGTLLDTGAPTTTIGESTDLKVDPRLVKNGTLAPATYVSVVAPGDDGDLDLAFLAGRASGVNKVDVKDNDEGYVNLGLVPFFRYDVMFDVENGVVGFAPCRNGARRRVLPVIRRMGGG
ncbi:MAG: hypothetical protein AB1689_02815 [Thermodesulfobacteriota bacterium]